MSIASEITRIKGKVADSFTACGAKGATMPESEEIANLPTCIESIQTGGSSAVLGTKSITANGTYNAVDDSLDGYSAVTVNVPTGGGGTVIGNDDPEGLGLRVLTIDYDGTVLKREYVAKGANATPPSPPEHEDLVFAEWNNDYENIQHDIVIGATYTTPDGFGSVFVDVTEFTGRSFRFNMNCSTTGTVVHWGDGQKTGRLYNQNNDVYHSYATNGRYKITFETDGYCALGKTNGYFNQSNLVVDKIYYTSHLKHTGYGVRSQAKAIVICKGAKNIYIQSSSFVALNAPCIVLPRTNAQIINPKLCYGAGVLKYFSLPLNGNTNTYLNNIGANAFYGCQSLEELALPASIKTINASAFYNCPRLARLTLLSDSVVALSNKDAFTNTNRLKIYVPDALVEDYKAATNWTTLATKIYPLSAQERMA